jgi:YfiH family protein
LNCHKVNGLQYYTFEALDRYGVPHAIFSRRGGVSPYPWASLNLGGSVGDEIERVRENRKRALDAIDLSIYSTYDVWQVHSAEVLCADKPREPDQTYQKADAILTDKKGVTLLMRFADCVPILLFDKNRGVIGIAHAGWQGTLLGVAEKAVQKMAETYGSKAEDIWAGIGPSIGGHHYPVGVEVWKQAVEKMPFVAEKSFAIDQGQVRFDLWLANQLILEQVGVRDIEVSGLCTACDLENWYSHRAENGKTGRFGVVISL